MKYDTDLTDKQWLIIQPLLKKRIEANIYANILMRYCT